MKRSMFCVSLVMLAACTGGYDAAAVCRNDCEARIENGCPPAVTDCDAACEGVQQFYDESRLDAEAAGCLVEFDAYYGCLSGGDVCDLGRCSAEYVAFTECMTP